ncbi:MAG: helix-turn-helix domain-containing protein [Gammaproteobacteria bacterium]
MLKKHRENQGLTLRQLCERAGGLDPGALSRIERGLRLPDLDTFHRLKRVPGFGRLRYDLETRSLVIGQ